MARRRHEGCTGWFKRDIYMIIKSTSLDIVCGYTSKVPVTQLPEYAFSGKSNVGKSSLINTLVNRKALARTSQQPGKTQTINYYNINNKLFLVDLPGYGYAKVSEQERRKWGVMIDRYLTRSKQLKKVFLLVDIRHAPGANDRQMFSWVVESGFEPVVIATKADKLSKSEAAAQLRVIRNTLGMTDGEPLIPFSAKTRQGRDEIWGLMDEVKEGQEDGIVKDQGSI
jgi:GTP-binding protein